MNHHRRVKIVALQSQFVGRCATCISPDDPRISEVIHRRWDVYVIVDGETAPCGFASYEVEDIDDVETITAVLYTPDDEEPADEEPAPLIEELNERESAIVRLTEMGMQLTDDIEAMREAVDGFGAIMTRFDDIVTRFTDSIHQMDNVAYRMADAAANMASTRRY